MRPLRPIVFVIVFVCLPVTQAAVAQITSYSEESAWLDAVGGPVQTEEFDDFAGVLVDQVPGVVFSSEFDYRPIVTDDSGHPSVHAHTPPNLFWSASEWTGGGGNWQAEFSPPAQAVAFWTGGLQFAGTTIHLWDSGGGLLGETDLYGAGGGHGPYANGFNGFVADSPPIARIVVNVMDRDWVWHDSFMVVFSSDIPGNLDGDGDVDITDATLFINCMNGPNVTTPPPGCEPADFEAADLDGDEDVDMRDCGLMQRFFTS